MFNSWFNKRKCRCGNIIEDSLWFCSFCGRDRFFGIKKWEYFSGGILLISLSVFTIYLSGSAIALVRPLFINHPASRQVVLSASPTPVSTSIRTAVPQIVMQETNTPYPSPEPTQSIPTPSISTDISNDCSGVTITTVHTPKGGTLHIERCADQWIYDTPPIANGIYQLDSNNHFLVYCTFDGNVYALQIGDPTIRFVENISQEMPIFRRNDNELSLSMTFLSGETQYWVTIADQTSGQSTIVKIPPIIWK